MLSRSTGSLSFSSLLITLLLLQATTSSAIEQPARLHHADSALLLALPADSSSDSPGEAAISDEGVGRSVTVTIPTKDLTAPLMAMARLASSGDLQSGGSDSRKISTSKRPTEGSSTEGPQLVASDSNPTADAAEKSSGVKVEGPVMSIEAPLPASKASSPRDESSGPSLGVPASPVAPKSKTAPSSKTETPKSVAQPKAVEKSSPAGNAKSPAKKSDLFEMPSSPRSLPKATLSETMIAVRDRVRWVLANYYQQPFNTRDNTAADILHACLAYGCQTEVFQGNEKINGITALCWNYPCAGYELLKKVDRHIAPRVGYGLQERPGQFLAVLALSRVPGDYPIRSGNDTRTVADLLEHEKLNCREGADQSLRLLGIGHYVIDDQTWKNDLKESWTVERLVKEELAQPVTHAAFGGTQRLLGLSYVLARQKHSGDVYAEADKFLKEFRQFAYKIQNNNGSWHPLYFLATGTHNDSIAQFRATAHVLQWLAVSEPESSLDDSRLTKAVEYVNSYLIAQNGRWNVPALDEQSIDAVTCAISALSLYNERAFKPFDKEPAKPEKANSSTDGKTAGQ